MMIYIFSAVVVWVLFIAASFGLVTWIAQIGMVTPPGRIAVTFDWRAARRWLSGRPLDPSGDRSAS